MLKQEEITTDNINEKPILTRTLMINMFWCLGLSLYWVIFLWRFWEKDVYALGLNACIFFLGLLTMFILPLYYEKKIVKKDLYWIIPLFLIPFSYLFYSNPFIKAINIFIYPMLGFLFINYGYLHDKEKRYWGINFISNFISRFFSFFGKIINAINYYIKMLSPRKQGTTLKVIIGIILLLLIALTIIFPLLSSADPVFGNKLAVVYDFINKYIAEIVIAKIIFFIIFSILLFSFLLAWAKIFNYPEKQENEKKVDSIISGIVLSGIFIIYLLFLWIQIERLWIGSLPFEFRETENLVKSGFWQLFFLSGLNTLIYFFTYRKTNALVQKILVAFNLASLLLLFSAGQRMAFYVVNYGFSYEKFFASYTVIYCAILFGWLFFCLFRKERANILKFLVFLFLWMYAIITVLPIEQFILHANVNLSKRSESRIHLFELTMLSTDVLSSVKKYKSEGVLKDDWQPWILKQEKRLAEKRWYEYNFNY